MADLQKTCTPKGEKKVDAEFIALSLMVQTLYLPLQRKYLYGDI